MDANAAATTTTTIAANGGVASTEPTALALYRERERRQRTVRLMVMIPLVLLLMYDDLPNNESRKGLRGNKASYGSSNHGENRMTMMRMESEIFQARLMQDETLQQSARTHPRYIKLQEKNKGIDYVEAVEQWAKQRSALEKDEFETPSVTTTKFIPTPQIDNDPEAAVVVWHYPWNATGFYRGEWTKVAHPVVDEILANINIQTELLSSTAPDQKTDVHLWSAVQLEDYLISAARQRYPNETTAAVVLLPPTMRLRVRNDHRLTSSRYDAMRVDSTGKVYGPSEYKHYHSTAAVKLTRNSGRAAFQLFARPVPAMRQLSIVDGFLKLYDSITPGYSTRNDILLRVRGVLVHATGRLSLVSSNTEIGQCALILMSRNSTSDGSANFDDENKTSPSSERKTSSSRSDTILLHERHRRLQLALAENNMNVIRDESLALYGDISTSRRLLVASDERVDGYPDDTEVAYKNEKNNFSESVSGMERKDSDIPPWSNIVIPFPFVRDDKDESIRKTRTAAARIMPQREEALEANAALCGFEINMDISPVEWTVGAWRKLLSHRMNELKKMDPDLEPPHDSTERETLDKSGSRPIPLNRQRRMKTIQDQALVVKMIGTIHSENCNFTAFLNTTALRTDWGATTSKAINYSFVMMIVCLIQIMVLLRQLLHSQAQLTATRVSILCIGWQTIIDALICLAHIYLSLAVQPLFTAFASVAFFKLLIFCVIEMKYMTIIIQARNSANGGQSNDVLRKQVAMLHLRFYVLLLMSFLLFVYLTDKYRSLYMLVLYSFWIPQIALNVWTEARHPLHMQYIYGMSMSRLISPLFIFAVQNNFLKEVFPDSPYDPSMVQMLFLWVGIQMAVLIAQVKFGARFMIPQRCLPPKFDYSRPIPSSMLPPGALDLPLPESMEDRDDGQHRVAYVHSDGHRDSLSTSMAPIRHQTAETTRNRYNRTRLHHQSSNTMTLEEPATISTSAQRVSLAPTLECSICYDAIDVQDRPRYMLAPCNHIFHRDCLVQWMDVKLECPICRTELPTL